MKILLKFFFLPMLLMGCLLLLSFGNKKPEKIFFPYKSQGLTERQAAIHLLNRFTYGPTSEEIDRIHKMGLEKWFLEQLNGNLKDDSLQIRLEKLDALKLSNTQVSTIYPRPATVLRMAIKEGYINKDSVDTEKRQNNRENLAAYLKDRGIKPQQDLFKQFVGQKIYKALYTKNQLQEVLTDFWFNHFNVSLTKNECAMYIPAYERDAIRPNILGDFSVILKATAKSPAMLFYLDNFSSAAPNLSKDGKLNEMAGNKIADSMTTDELKKFQSNKKNQGLNENYAREVMELHTMGVDGGYTQSDVTNAAKILTGWTVYPFDKNGPGNAYKKVVDQIGEENLAKRGFVHDGDFMFFPARHDKTEKVVLGRKFNANGGYEEGIELLDMLAQHPSTAKFISRKLAVRFVSDQPSEPLIDKMAKTFTQTNGNIKKVLISMVTSTEFWSKAAINEKTKSPFELAISSVRALNGQVSQPIQLNNWIAKMGQEIYRYQAPTGFPDRGQYWINTGALLNRMNYGLALAANKIPGVKVDVAALNQYREPESTQQALLNYGNLMMPERDLSKSLDRLIPLLNDAHLYEKVDAAANKNLGTTTGNLLLGDDHPKENKTKNLVPVTSKSSSVLAQVVGVIIGSPEFQRR